MSEQVEKVVALLRGGQHSTPPTPLTLDELWPVIYELLREDPVARQVEYLAAAQGWGRERFATTLALVLLAHVKDNRAEIFRLTQLQPPPPIHVTVTPARMEEIKKMAQGPRNRS